MPFGELLPTEHTSMQQLCKSRKNHVTVFQNWYESDYLLQDTVTVVEGMFSYMKFDLMKT
jgi:hypothetical protein